MPMDGRAFLDVARDLAAGPTEAHRRSAASRAYYALFHEALATLQRWGFTVPPHQNVHASVRLRFTYSGDPDVKKIGDALDDLVKLRNRADYQLVSPGLFTTTTRAVQAVADARDAIALLDQVDGDARRRAAAIASIRP
jgi:uncharacterized protein (UPF0332 family)